MTATPLGEPADGRLAYSDDYNAADGPGYHNDAWYSGARSSKAGQCLWSKAYQDAVTGMPMITCSMPYQFEGRFAGVATLDLLLDDWVRFLTEQGKVTDGYAFALDQVGNVLHFPGITGAKGSSMLQRIAEETDPLQTEAAQLGALSSTLAGCAEQPRQESSQLAAAITEMSSRLTGLSRG